MTYTPTAQLCLKAAKHAILVKKWPNCDRTTKRSMENIFSIFQQSMNRPMSVSEAEKFIGQGIVML